MANAIVSAVNWIINALVTALNAILAFLPDSPFLSADFSPIRPYLGYLNWVFPIRQMLVFLGIWLSGVLVYYAYQAILRVTQAID